MKEIVTIFQNYCGSGWYPVLFLAALLYLLVTEKKKQIRVVLVDFDEAQYTCQVTI